MQRYRTIGLTEDDVTAQSGLLLNGFILDRLKHDETLDRRDIPESLSEAGGGKAPGPPMEHIREIGRALNTVAEELEDDVELQKSIEDAKANSSNSVYICTQA